MRWTGWTGIQYDANHPTLSLRSTHVGSSTFECSGGRTDRFRKREQKTQKLSESELNLDVHRWKFDLDTASLASNNPCLWVMSAEQDTKNRAASHQTSPFHFSMDQRTLGLLTVAIFELFSSSILVPFSPKNCSNGGKNWNEKWLKNGYCESAPRGPQRKKPRFRPTVADTQSQQIEYLGNQIF